jgi:DinB family protein
MTDGEREAFFQRYENGPALLRAALERAPAAMHQWRPAPDKWSVHEIIVHCADSETISATRIRFLVGETTPTISGYDQDRWARSMNYAKLPLGPSLAQVDAVRAWTAAFIRTLPPAAWEKSGRHTEYDDPYTAEQWLRIYAEHLEVHARQIARTVDQWKSAGSPTGGS